MKGIDKITIVSLALSLIFTMIGLNMYFYKNYKVIPQYRTVSVYLIITSLAWSAITIISYFMLRVSEPVSLKKRLGLLHFTMLIVISSGFQCPTDTFIKKSYTNDDLINLGINETVIEVGNQIAKLKPYEMYFIIH